MAKFELPDAVNLFQGQTSNITGLWAVYAVGTFAVAGFGGEENFANTGLLIAVTVGFWLFVLCHLALITQPLFVTRELEREMKLLLEENPEAAGQFPESIRRLAHTANPVWRTVALHLLVDICVTMALLAPLYAPPTAIGPAGLATSATPPQGAPARPAP